MEYIKRSMLFLLICMQLQMYAYKDLTHTHMPIFKNESAVDFYVSVGIGVPRFFLARHSSIDTIKSQQRGNWMQLAHKVLIALESYSEKAPSIFIKFGGYASGQCEPGEAGPFDVAYWREFRDAPKPDRMHVRYCQRGYMGTLGLRIDPSGNPEILAFDRTRIVK